MTPEAPRGPLDCTHVRDLTCAYLDHEIDDDLRAVVERHLAECPGCRDLFREHRIVKALLRRSCRDTLAPARLRDRVWAAVLAQGGQGGTWSVNAASTTISHAGPDGTLVRRTTVTGAVVVWTPDNPVLRPQGNDREA